jgi:pectinesterase
MLISQQISEAIAALSTTTTSTQTIFIEEGTYEEQVYIPKLAGELIIYGQTEEYVFQLFQTHDYIV